MAATGDFHRAKLSRENYFASHDIGHLGLCQLSFGGGGIGQGLWLLGAGLDPDGHSGSRESPLLCGRGGLKPGLINGHS